MQKPCVVILLVLAACACDRMKETLHPVDTAAVEAYHKADQALLERARQGVRISMTLVDPDGSSIEGFDEIISGPPHRMREIRPDYEAVGVGDVICQQDKSSDVPVCEEGEFEAGLKELDVSEIRRARSIVVPCGNATCRRVRIEQASTPSTGIARMLKYRRASAEERRLVVVLLIREDGLPHSLAAWRWSGGKRVEGQATYLFDYDTPVSSIELPSQASSVESPKGDWVE